MLARRKLTAIAAAILFSLLSIIFIAAPASAFELRKVGPFDSLLDCRADRSIYIKLYDDVRYCYFDKDFRAYFFSYDYHS
ncbi:DUF4179 domain-containing protein [Cryptosporangium aurantiacum]|uniref:Uncharacterized protein n=1 Tax=Cryptosporangium aurantiacum TaxID=134849 RepID=A0A1M7RP31_9ACTN|nr:DUF4179 domain-containing protein [Cryptosporangium aurantiacum]SHN47910.1 hypothetical protein SAMN05443668_13013 [Cryptosporangium aurantiacum]